MLQKYNMRTVTAEPSCIQAEDVFSRVNCSNANPWLIILRVIVCREKTFHVYIIRLSVATFQRAAKDPLHKTTALLPVEVKRSPFLPDREPQSGKCGLISQQTLHCSCSPTIRALHPKPTREKTVQTSLYSG